jgi:hypothetical protein
MEKSGNGKFFNKDGALVNSHYDAKGNAVQHHLAVSR